MREFEKRERKEHTKQTEHAEHEHEQWKKSDGELQKKIVPDERGERYDKGEKKMTGYNPSVKEKLAGTAPREIARMESSYGAVSLGISRKKEVTVAVSEKRRHNAPTVAKAQKEVNGNRMVAKRRSYFFNNDTREKGAVVYRKKSDISNARMQRGLKRIVNSLRSETAEKTIPFLAERKLAGRSEEKLRQEQARQKNLENRLINELYSSLEKGNKKISAELAEMPVYYQKSSSAEIEDGTEEENADDKSKNNNKNKNVR